MSSTLPSERFPSRYPNRNRVSWTLRRCRALAKPYSLLSFITPRLEWLIRANSSHSPSKGSSAKHSLCYPNLGIPNKRILINLPPSVSLRSEESVKLFDPMSCTRERRILTRLSPLLCPPRRPRPCMEDMDPKRPKCGANLHLSLSRHRLPLPLIWVSPSIL
jgi:hypothetical protein